MHFRPNQIAAGLIALTCAAALFAFAATICSTSFAWASDSPDSQSQQTQQEQQLTRTADSSFTQNAQAQASGDSISWTTASLHTDALASSFQIGAAFATFCDATLETLSNDGEGSASLTDGLVGATLIGAELIEGGLVGGDDSYCTTDDPTDAIPVNVDPLGTHIEKVSVAGNVCYSDAHELLDKVNAARAAVGADALTWDSQLEQTAMQRAAEITISWSHTRPNGEQCFTAFTNIKKTAGENIAMGQATSTIVNNSWTKSDGHYQNMIATKYKSMGAACLVTDDGMHYWVEVFNGADGDGVYIATGQKYSSFTVETLAEGSTYDTAGAQKYTLNVGRTTTMNYAPDGESAAAASTLTFESSNKAVATISSKGVITAVAPGTSTLKVTENSSGKTLFTTTVTVTRNYMFNDVLVSDWFATDDILGYSVSHNLITGYSEGQFGPYDSVTRGQVATILWRMAGSPSASAAKFSDVDYSKYYGTAINWARVTGIITGYDTSSGKVFRPEQSITREEFCVMLQRYAQKIAGVSTSVSSKMKSTYSSYSDSSNVSSWAVEAVEWAIGNGLMSGEQSGKTVKINPKGTTYRCAAAKMVSILDRDVL